MHSVSAESTTCAGFPVDTYDRYVLGLLDKNERMGVDRQIEAQCPVCIKGVQRSMNLWLVYANSLEGAEPSADFRARLVRIADLSKRVLTVPKRNRRVKEPAILISSLVVFCLVLALLLVFTWIAGRQSYQMDAQRTTSEMARLRSDRDDYQLKLLDREARINLLTEQLKNSGRPETNVARLQDQISKLQAQVQQDQTNISRDREKNSDNVTLVTALENPGVKLLTFKTAEGAPSTAYAFVIQNTKVVFVASKLAVPAAGHQYQLWLVRKDEPFYLSAGNFNVTDDKPVVVTYEEDKKAISSLAGLLVTEEDINGSYTAPSTVRVMETPGVPAAAAVPTITPAPATN